MGLFDMFKSDAGTEMTPHFAFVTALIYMIAADGEIQNEEIGQLLSVLGGEKSSNGVIGVGAQNEKLLRNAQKYVQSNSPDKFLEEAAPLLTDAQKMCILTNLCDSLLSDGNADPTEQQLFYKFMQGFGIGGIVVLSSALYLWLQDETMHFDKRKSVYRYYFKESMIQVII